MESPTQKYDVDYDRINIMHVINRHGEKEPVSFDQILLRLTKLSRGLHNLVDPARVAQSVINGMYSGIKTCVLDELASQTCAYMAPTHPDYARLAARLAIDNLHKQTSSDFSQVIIRLQGYKDPQGRDAPLISDHVVQFVVANKDLINTQIDYQRDFDYDYFGFKTLERSYLLRLFGEIVERPQHMLMRVACGIHYGDIERTIQTYHLLSTKYFTHATPTLFNAGSPKPQMSSCFLLTIKDDSIDGIFDTLKQCALISKTAGGIGVAVHCVRATNSYIRGTSGRSNGLIPMLKVYNDTARYVDQGGGKRKGSFAIYLEPWHADIFEFLDLRKNHGKEELRCRDLFFALWVPDLFMKRVEMEGNWTLFCPNECPGLQNVYGKQFEELYTSYESQKRGRKTLPARDLWFKICESQTETGTPYMLYKDACNQKSNQKNLGTIQSSNLCTEIIQYTSKDEVAVCNLASVALPKYVILKHDSQPNFDHQKLYEVTKIVTLNLNRVIDRNYYPVNEARYSNMRHRPIGIGVQGLADCFMLMRFPFESEEAKTLNREIFETIYFAACEASHELAIIDGPYSTFPGSPMSEGKFQFDLWRDSDREALIDKNNEKNKDEKNDKKNNDEKNNRVKLSGRWDWDTLRSKIVQKGIRNSLLVAPMPTASTSQILGNNEAFEPYTSNIYSRRVLSGEFCVVNPHLLKDLIALGLWDEDMKQKLVGMNGSIQCIPEIPNFIKSLYKTVWEIKQKTIIDMAADRGPFIDQSQSLNIHMTSPTYAKLSAMHFHGWRSGLKTGTYYLRTQAAVDAIKFTIAQNNLRTPSAIKMPSEIPFTPETTSGYQSNFTSSPLSRQSPDNENNVDNMISNINNKNKMNNDMNNKMNNIENNEKNEKNEKNENNENDKSDENNENDNIEMGLKNLNINMSCPMRPPKMSLEEHCDMCSG